MGVIKNMMVRAGVDFSAFTKQAKKASSSMRGMQNNVTRSCNQIKRAVSGVNKVLGALGVAAGVTALASGAKEAAEAYDNQAEAEMKLATVMRNTMSARNSEIQSVLDLCTAQQKLGVIGDEAQIAGAQELATYLTMSSSLKRLIPVMNDMAAQQYGLKASAEQVTNIATMLGKVMEGQTGALRRYGYYFTEAEEAVLKTGNEEQRVALLAKIVMENVGGMNHALAQTPSGRMRQLNNALGDIKEKFGECVRTIGVLLLPLLWKVAEVLEVITNWANKALNSISKVFGYASLLVGWQDIDTGVATLGDEWEDLSDYVTGAGDAAAEAKRKMLGFDELNVLGGNGADAASSAAGPYSGISGGAGAGGSSGGSSGSSGGLLGGLKDLLGGGGSDEDLPWLTSLLYKVKDHLGIIKDLALSTGAAFLTWKLLKGTQTPLAKILGIVSAVFGATLEAKSGFRAWTEGVNMDNLYGMLEGAIALTLGLGTAFGKTGAEVGLLVGGVGLLTVGIKDWITAGTLGTETFYMMEGGLVAVTAGLALMGAWIPAIVTGIAAVGLAVYNYWDDIKAGWRSFSDWFFEATSGFVDSFAAWGERHLTNVMNAVARIGGWINTAQKNVATTLVSTLETCQAWWIQTLDTIHAKWKVMLANGKSIFAQVKATITTKISETTSYLSGVSWVDIGANLMQGFLNGIRSLMSTIWNEVVSFVQRVTAAVRGALGIHSPSTVWEDIGLMLDAGLAKGLEAGIPDVLEGAGDISAALAASVHPEVLTPGAISGQYGAPSPAADAAEGDAAMDALLQAVLQMYDWLRTEGARPHTTMIDGRAVFETVVEENNRAIRRTGASPIRV